VRDGSGIDPVTAYDGNRHTFYHSPMPQVPFPFLEIRLPQAIGLKYVSFEMPESEIDRGDLRDDHFQV